MLDFGQPFVKESTSAMIERVGVDIQWCDLERCFERAWDTRKDYIPEQQAENCVNYPPFRMQPIAYE